MKHAANTFIRCSLIAVIVVSVLGITITSASSSTSSSFTTTATQSSRQHSDDGTSSLHQKRKRRRKHKLVGSDLSSSRKETNLPSSDGTAVAESIEHTSTKDNQSSGGYPSGRRRRRRKVCSNMADALDGSQIETDDTLTASDRQKEVMSTDGDVCNTQRRRKKGRRKPVLSDASIDCKDSNTDRVLLPTVDEDALYESDHELDDELSEGLMPEIETLLQEPNDALQSSSMQQKTPASITFSNNETSESLINNNEMDDDSPTTWVSTTSHEEETIESTMRPDTLKDTTSATPTTTSTTFHSSKQYENVQVIEGDTGQVITVKMTRQRKERSVQITRNRANAQPKNKPSLSKPKTMAKATGKGGECLRRIKREWKDAVKTGIAYDWTAMRTVGSSNNESRNNDYVRIGPFGKNLLRWHFSVMGPSNSVYEGGVYHGRVLLPKDYPGSPPRVQVSFSD